MMVSVPNDYDIIQLRELAQQVRKTQANLNQQRTRTDQAQQELDDLLRQMSGLVVSTDVLEPDLNTIHETKDQLLEVIEGWQQTLDQLETQRHALQSLLLELETYEQHLTVYQALTGPNAAVARLSAIGVQEVEGDIQAEQSRQEQLAQQAQMLTFLEALTHLEVLRRNIHHTMFTKRPVWERKMRDFGLSASQLRDIDALIEEAEQALDEACNDLLKSE